MAILSSGANETRRRPSSSAALGAQLGEGDAPQPGQPIKLGQHPGGQGNHVLPPHTGPQKNCNELGIAQAYWGPLVAWGRGGVSWEWGNPCSPYGSRFI